MNLENIFGNKFTNAISTLDWAGNTVVRLIDLLQSMALEGFITVHEMLFSLIESVTNINQYPNASAILNFTADVATSLLIIFFLKQIFTNYVLDLDGEADYDVIQSVTNISVALAVINCAGEIHQILMKACSLLQSGLTDSLVQSITDAKLKFGTVVFDTISKMEFVFNGFFQIGTPYGPSLLLLACIWGLVVVILFVILLFKMLFRGVELLFFQILLPVFAVDLISPQKELWKPFLQEYLKTIFGYLLQHLAYYMALSLMYEATTVSSNEKDIAINLLLSTIILYFSVKTPKWLQKFTYSSGVGQAVSSGGRSAMGTVSSVAMMSRYIK